MVAVDKNRFLADQPGQTGPALDLDFMRGIGVSGTAVPYGRRFFAIFQQLAAKILIQSSSQCDNEELHPAANCQNGKILTKCRAKETDFEVVPFGIHSHTISVRFAIPYTRAPSCVKRSIAPAAPSSMSSGWAPTTSTRSVMGTDTGPLSKERSKIRRATAMMRTISAIS